MAERPPVLRMPWAAPPGDAGKAQRARAYDTARRKHLPLADLYHSARWRRLRAEHLKREPVCQARRAETRGG